MSGGQGAAYDMTVPRSQISEAPSSLETRSGLTAAMSHPSRL